MLSDLSFGTETEKSGPFEPDLVETSVGKWLMYVIYVRKYNQNHSIAGVVFLLSQEIFSGKVLRVREGRRHIETRKVAFDLDRNTNT